MSHEINGSYIQLTTQSRVTHGDTTFANEICRDIDVLDPESVEEDLYKYKARNEKFAPVPSDSKYIDIKENCTYEIYEDMFVEPYTEIETLLQLLYEYPFLLVDHRSDIKFHIYDEYEESELLPLNEPDRVLSYDEALEEFPSIEQVFFEGQEPQYGIISLSELNKRRIRDVFYPVIAEFEKSIAEKIREEYPCSEDLTEVVSEPTVNAWKKNRDTNAEVHISEFMDLKDMERLVSDSRSLATSCGFNMERSINDLSDVDNLNDLRAFDPEYVLSEIRELRNKTMHANRVFVHDVNDLASIINQYGLLCAFIDEISNEMYIQELDASSESS